MPYSKQHVPGSHDYSITNCCCWRLNQTSTTKQKKKKRSHTMEICDVPFSTRSLYGVILVWGDITWGREVAQTVSSCRTTEVYCTFFGLIWFFDLSVGDVRRSYFHGQTHDRGNDVGVKRRCIFTTAAMLGCFVSQLRHATTGRATNEHSGAVVIKIFPWWTPLIRTEHMTVIMKPITFSFLSVFGTAALAYVASGRTSHLAERGKCLFTLISREGLLTRVNIAAVTRLGHSGNYQFVNCEDDQGTLIATLLQKLYSTLLSVIQDAKGSASHPSAAYRNFFKDPSQAAYVAKIITEITVGNAMYPANPPFSKGNPTFACVTQGAISLHMPDGTIQDAYDNCINNRLGAAYIYPTPTIVLCPVFFSFPAYPPADACPRVTRRTNHFVRKPEDDNIAGSSIWQNQMWILFHEVVHYYLYAQPGYVPLKPEAYNINRAWKLGAGEAVRNSENFVFYAYSECVDAMRWWLGIDWACFSCFCAVYGLDDYAAEW